MIYEAFCLDVAQGRMNGAPNETRSKKNSQKTCTCSLEIFKKETICGIQPNLFMYIYIYIQGYIAYMYVKNIL